MDEKAIKPKKAQKAEFIAEKEAEQVTMSDWVNLKINQDKKLNKAQRSEILIFLKKQGLKDIEKASEYEKAFSRF